MYSINKPLSLLSLSILSSLAISAQAQTLSGQVLDTLGKPLSEGSVQIMGTNTSTKIAKDGRFLFEDIKPGNIEIHVASSRHIHSKTELMVPQEGLFDIEIVVAKSSIEIFDVTASAFHASTIESAAPVSVISGDELRKKQAATLGDTLKNEIGVHSTFYGSVASSPIIRGLDGPRVLITQNGLDSGDASRVGPDHIVSTDTSTATQVEVLRGPATLFYGSGAIGGVVNVVDQRIPDNNDFEGEISADRNSNNSEESFAGFVKGGSGNVAFNFQGYYKDAENYRIPGYAQSEEAHEHDDEEHDDEEHGDEAFGVVENSDSRSKGLTFGASYLLDNGYIGFSVEHMASLYGIPGHAHEEEHDEDHEDELGEDLEAEEVVKGDLQQNRYQIASNHQLDTDFISAINTGFAFTDYQHAEIENGEIGTVFKNKSQEARIELIHQPVAGWRGGFSFHYKSSDFEAIGDEAFTPPSKTDTLGMGMIEEQHFGDVLFQLGARIERVDIDVPQIQIGETQLLAQHSEDMHDELTEDDHEHEDHEHESELTAINSSRKSFTPVSFSVGAVWDFTEGYNVGVSYVHAQRAPSSAEIFSYGPHIGTSTYEIGAFYDINDEGEVVFSGQNLDIEKSNNIDISLRKFNGDFGFVLNAFYNQVEDYYFSGNTGFVIESEHEHDDAEHLEEDHADDHSDEVAHEGHSDELPVYLYSHVDVDLYGVEAQFNWQASPALQIQVQGDLIRNKLKGNEDGSKYLPRTPPSRLGISADYIIGDWQAEVSVHRYFSQSAVAEFETQTSGYTLLDLDINYLTSFNNTDVTFYVKGRNLSDEEARVHTSFLKDSTPVQGRAVVVGVRANF